jgi:hypothetical protein
MAFEKGDIVRGEVLDVKDNGIYTRYESVDVHQEIRTSRWSSVIMKIIMPPGKAIAVK